LVKLNIFFQTKQELLLVMLWSSKTFLRFKRHMSLKVLELNLR